MNFVKGSQLEVPVKVGQRIELTITDYGHEGEGVGRYKNFAIFVPEVLKNERVLVKLAEVKKNFARGVVLKILQAVPERISPSCRIANECGGCQLQHLGYQDQLKLKQQLVGNVVERIGGLKGVEIHPVLGMAAPWHYRSEHREGKLLSKSSARWGPGGGNHFAPALSGAIGRKLFFALSAVPRLL